jgi:hypothetical protein
MGQRQDPAKRRLVVPVGKEGLEAVDDRRRAARVGLEGGLKMLRCLLLAPGLQEQVRDRHTQGDVLVVLGQEGLKPLQNPVELLGIIAGHRAIDFPRRGVLAQMLVGERQVVGRMK